jgi:hypothetical protein
MGTPNREKTEKSILVSRAWQTVHYQNDTTNCGNCDFANPKWLKTKGECNLVDRLPFPVSSFGICRQHSRFRDK